MTDYIEGSGKFGVKIKFAGGGSTTYYYEDKATQDRNFSRIKKEVTKNDKVSKKNR